LLSFGLFLILLLDTAISIMQTDIDDKQATRKREETLSKDGQWRSFPNVPCLLQYVSNGNYYGRVRVDGKLIRESLKTDVWSTAKLRLADLITKSRENRDKVITPEFSEALELFKRDLNADVNMKPGSKEYRLGCILKLQRTWPDLWELHLDEIKSQACKDWAAEIQKKISGQYYNNMIGTLRLVIDRGIKEHKEKTGIKLENPASELKRVRIKQRDLRLPEPAHFKLLVENLRQKSGGWGPRVADLVEFLAFSGMRIKSEALRVKWEDVDWERKEIVVRGKPDTRTKNGEIRRVPFIKDMENLLTRLKDELGTIKPERVLQVSRAHESLARACKEIGIPRLRHHDFRHLFATRCIESGVDVPTVSKWLGHKDGGSLAMKVYGHLRDEHSKLMAEKVKF
jgi:integrase